MTTRRPPIAPIDLRRAARLALGLSAVWSCGCPTAPPLREVDPDVVAPDAPGPDAPALDRDDARSTPDVVDPDATVLDATAPDATAPDATELDAKTDDVLDVTAPDDALDATPDVVALDALAPDASLADRVAPTDVATCPVAMCAGRCVDTQTDVAHCGACGRACATGASCAAGACACPAGLSVCDGRCVNTMNDGANCGACGTTCLAPRACTSGRCAAVCSPGQTACSGSCVDTTSDVANCGSCGHACAYPHGGAACVAGTCRLPGCLAGWGDCDGNPENGCERAIVDDVNNCGGCNVRCDLRAAVSVCRGSSCAVSSCLLQYRDCNGVAADGCETNTYTDRASCGACGVACPSSPHATPTCELGACGRACDPGYGDCNGVAGDGCETSLSTRSDCGACGHACPYYPHTEPACGIECEWRCEDCWINNDGVIDNGCERQIC